MNATMNVVGPMVDGYTLLGRGIRVVGAASHGGDAVRTWDGEGWGKRGGWNDEGAHDLKGRASRRREKVETLKEQLMV